jgi:hypothetical protein
MNPTISRSPSRVPTSLESWTRHDWRHGVLLPRLGPYDQLIVRTRNSTYEIIVIEPRTASVLVRGGNFFPEFSRARVAGSSLGGGCLKVHGVYAGFQMELVAGERILTTCVQTVSVLPAGIGPVM